MFPLLCERYDFMSVMKIVGNKKLKGSVIISGAKNSVLPLLAAAVLCDGESVFYNCPDITDVEISIEILRHLGLDASYNSGTVRVEGRVPANTEIPERMMRKMRSSVIFLGSLLGRRKKATVSAPGGCELGPRPIDIHINALKNLGANFSEEHGLLKFSAPEGLKGTRIDLKMPSVGATENIILASVLAEGKTVINNAAREPEIEDLVCFLKKAGADISGEGSSTVIINGVKALHGVSHTVIPDRIEAATYMSAAAVTGGDVTVKHINPGHLGSITAVFEKMGCNIKLSEDSLRIVAPKSLTAVPFIKTFAYPDFPTDAGPVVVAALLKAKGSSVFAEGVFKNRYRYIDELNRMGAGIKTEGNVAVIEGGVPLFGAHCVCTDLRGGAALTVAALAAEGTTYLSNTGFIKRGYERFEEKLTVLGAEIYTEEE